MSINPLITTYLNVRWLVVIPVYNILDSYVDWDHFGVRK